MIESENGKQHMRTVATKLMGLERLALIESLNRCSGREEVTARRDTNSIERLHQLAGAQFSNDDNDWKDLVQSLLVLIESRKTA